MNCTIAFDIKGEFEDRFKTFDKFDKQDNLSRRVPTQKEWNVFKKDFGHLSREELAFFIFAGSANG